MSPAPLEPPIEFGAIARFQSLEKQNPDAPFLRFEDVICNRKEFIDSVAKMAFALKRAGIAPGDVVVLCSPNRLEWCTSFWGAVAIGARPAPLDPAMGVWEFAGLLPILAPRLAIATTSFRGTNPARRLTEVQSELLLVTLDGDCEGGVGWDEFLAGACLLPFETRKVPEDEILLYACTSGTTGNPKILAVPHLGFLRSQIDMGNYLGFSAFDRILLGMPLFHQGGFGMGLQGLVSGALTCYVQSFDPESFISAISAMAATVVQLSPTLAKLLVSSPRFSTTRRQNWHTAYFAGETLSEDLAAVFYRDFGLRVVNVVGSSETGTMLAWDSKVDGDCSPSDLSVLPFTHAKVLDEDGSPVPNNEPGVLHVSTDALLLRYEGNKRLTAESLRHEAGRRWFCTGDLVQQLPSERYRFLGRLKRIIKRGANLVHSEELEAFLLGHPQIAAVAIGKEAHPVIGELIIAWVQMVDGGSLTRTELLTYCRERISSYKIPDRVNFVEKIPTDVGKVQHLRIRTASS
jgi:fatty-acyl-CoA synthase